MVWIGPFDLKQNFAGGEIPSGAINGANLVFLLARIPLSGSLSLYKNGLNQLQGLSNDYTLSGLTITFTSGAVPVPGDDIFANYAY